MKFKFDVGNQVTVPKLDGGYCPGMVMGHDVNNRTYIVKQDSEELAQVWTQELFEQVAFVSQLSFKEQMMEEFERIYSSLFVQTDTEALHKKLDEMSINWRPR